MQHPIWKYLKHQESGFSHQNLSVIFILPSSYTCTYDNTKYWLNKIKIKVSQLVCKCFTGNVNYMMRNDTWGLYRWKLSAVYGRKSSPYKTGSLRSWTLSSSGTQWTPVIKMTVIIIARKYRTPLKEWEITLETVEGWHPFTQWMKKDKGS